MEIVIASNEQAAVVQLRGCLASLGIDCSRLQVVSHDAAQLVSTSSQKTDPAILFFASPHLTTNELALLNRLCAEKSENVKVVVVSFNLTAAAILQAVRSGAADCISLSSNLESDLSHLLDRLRSSTGERNYPGRLWTVISSVGGSGNSIIATNLAALVAQKEERCCLLDLHWQGGDLATLLNLQPRHTLMSLASKTEQLDRTMLEHSLIRHNSGIYLLASPDPFSDYRQIKAELIQKIVQVARTAFPTVVVDLEDCQHFDQVRTLASSDRVVVPMRPDFVSLVRTKKLLHHLLGAGVVRDHVRIVVNRTGQPKELAHSQIEKALEMQIRFQLADDVASINEAINLGMPLVNACRHSKVTAGLTRLAESLLESSQNNGTEKSPRSHSARTALWPSLKSVAHLFANGNSIEVEKQYQ